MKKLYYRAEIIDGVPKITPVEMSYRAAGSRRRKVTVKIFDFKKSAALWLIAETYRTYRMAEAICDAVTAAPPKNRLA